MAKTKSSLKSIAFVYDFAVDGGATSTIGMGAFLPANSLIWDLKIAPITAVTSGAGLATLEIGTINTTVNSIMVQVVAPTFLGLVAVGANGILTLGNASALKNARMMVIAPDQISITIGVEAFTAGKFIANIMYQELN